MENGIMAGLCECGCGEATPIARVNARARGWIRGQHIRFCFNHDKRGARKPRPAKGRYRFRVAVVGGSSGKAEHINIVEKALGHPLPKGVQVHHVNEVRDDNRNGNLVACQDTKYHRLLHVRTAALKATGTPNHRMCASCSHHDDPANMVRHGRKSFMHLACRKARWAAFRESRRAVGEKTWR